MAWTLLQKGEAFGENSNYMEFLIDDESDIQTPPDVSYAPSSLAHTPGWGHIYESDRHGNWVEIGV